MSIVWNRLRYSFWAPWYDALVAKADFGAARSLSLQRLELAPNAHVLLVGAGTGLDLGHLPATVTITAIDVSPAMLDRLRARARQRGLKIESRIMDAHRLEFGDGTFDAVVLHLILSVVGDPAQSLREAERVLKPDGRLAVFDKFLGDDEEVPLARFLANLVIKPLFSDLNRRLGPLVRQANVEVVRDEPVAFGGMFRVITLKKQTTGQVEGSIRVR